MKIYTKTGDNGTTGLFAGPRVAKDHPRINAYGTVDELNAVLGLLTAEVGEGAEEDVLLAERLRQIQSDLLAIGAELATPDPDDNNMRLLPTSRITALEHWIDQVDSELRPLDQFILPGGTRGSALLHFARTVCRRAEREVVHLSLQIGVADCSQIIIYLNRLSDLLFMLARQHNMHMNVADIAWTAPRK